MRLPSRAKATSRAKTNISGEWRITEMDLWDEKAIDLLGPAFIEFKGARGQFRSFADPMTESNDLKDVGHRAEAYKILMELCQADLRCLDAHAHLGTFVFDRSPEEAIRHYEVGLRIGELSLGESFEGVLPWGHIDNRPFLRCMHGYGLCL